MALPTDLTGLGMSAWLAQRMAATDGGKSSLVIAAAGTTQADATAIGGNQRTVAVTSGTGGAALPARGGANGALLGDEFMVSNVTSSSITLYGQVGDSLNWGGSNIAGSVGIAVAAHTTTVCRIVSSVQWVGIAGT